MEKKTANFNKKELCSYSLRKDDVLTFQDAIENDYYFEFIYGVMFASFFISQTDLFADDLPVWGFVGEMTTEDNTNRYFLFTHYIFRISYNDDRVVEISWEHDPSGKKEITDDKDTKVTFHYSAVWSQSDVEYDNRQMPKDDLVDNKIEIHWFSIFNSFVTVLLLTGFLATILIRVLKNDFSRYAKIDDEMEADGTNLALPDFFFWEKILKIDLICAEDETGWKLVHGDVFRFPPHPILFSAVIGNGTQFLCMCFGLLILAMAGVFWRSRCVFGSVLFPAGVK